MTDVATDDQETTVETDTAINDYDPDSSEADEETVIAEEIFNWREAFTKLEEKRSKKAGKDSDEQRAPVPHLDIIEQTGVVVVSFSTDMHVMPDMKMLSKGKVQIDGVTLPVFQIEVIPSQEQKRELLDFSWEVIKMTEREIHS